MSKPLSVKSHKTLVQPKPLTFAKAVAVADSTNFPSSGLATSLPLRDEADELLSAQDKALVRAGDMDASPGPLRSESFVTLQTRQAQRLVLGRKSDTGAGQSGIIGLTRYATILRSIWGGARADDPYADWWLIKVHDALEQASQELDARAEHVGRILKQLPGISVTVGISIEPLRIPLTFTNPYAFRGAYLLAKYDDLVRAILTARHVAMLDRDASEKMVFEAGRQVRRAFLAALGYRFLGITRDDVRLMTARIKEAEHDMGKLPKDVLEGQLRAPFAPDLPKRRGVPVITAADGAGAPVERSGAAPENRALVNM